MRPQEWALCMARVIEGWPEPAWTMERMAPYTSTLEALHPEDVDRAISVVIERAAKLADARHARFPPPPAELYSLALIHQSKRLTDAKIEAASHFGHEERRAIASGERVLVPRWLGHAAATWLRGGRNAAFPGPDPFDWPTGWCTERGGPREWCALPRGHPGPHDVR